MLLFGHSSLDFRESKANPYGFVFSKLNELIPGDVVEVLRNGNQYLYAVQETVIKHPNRVNEVIDAHQNDSYLTLMACFPLYSTSKRILVIAKKMNPGQVAQHI